MSDRERLMAREIERLYREREQLRRFVERARKLAEDIQTDYETAGFVVTAQELVRDIDAALGRK